MKYPVRNAGFGLAFLFMTVLGFDNITWGYCLQQCITESVLGALVGVSAIFGVSGSISFPFLRKKLGLARTGELESILSLRFSQLNYHEFQIRPFGYVTTRRW